MNAMNKEISYERWMHVSQLSRRELKDVGRRRPTSRREVCCLSGTFRKGCTEGTMFRGGGTDCGG